VTSALRKAAASVAPASSARPRVRVLRLTRGYAPRTDGWSRHATRLSESQAKSGHDVLVVQPEHPSRKRGRLHETRVAGSAVNRRGSWGVLYFALTALIALLITGRRSRFDVIHVHGDALEIAAAAVCAKALAIPTIATLHAPPSTKSLHWALLRLVVPQVRGFIAVSPLIQRDLVRAGAKPSSILVQSSGVDLDRLVFDEESSRLQRRRIGRGDEDVIVLFAGRLEAAKGVDTLVRAMGRLPDHVHAVIAGSGTLRGRLEREARGQRIHFVGAVSHDRVEELLAAADVLVLPSVDLPGTTEGTPTVILEAFAARVPVIATRAGGIPSVITHGETGLLVGQRSDVELAEAILRLTGDRALRERLISRALEVVRPKDWTLVAERITDFTVAMLRPHA
jgi:glycosyltransferase involved in cell wall biosynthesis